LTSLFIELIDLGFERNEQLSVRVSRWKVGRNLGRFDNLLGVTPKAIFSKNRIVAPIWESRFKFDHTWRLWGPILRRHFRIASYSSLERVDPQTYWPSPL
jgi:hypothetical protein